MSKPSKNKTNNSFLAPLAIGFCIGVVSVTCAVLVWNQSREPRRYSVAPSSETPQPSTALPAAGLPAFSELNSPGSSQLEPAVARVASRFVCTCGGCDEEPLDVCSCERAQAERDFIQKQLRDGHTAKEAAEALNQKYGGLKS